MDDQKTPPAENSTPTPPPPVPQDPQAAAEEDAILNEVKKLETEEQNEVHTDAEIIDKREEAGKELEQEALNPAPMQNPPAEGPLTQPASTTPETPTTEPEPSTETS